MKISIDEFNKVQEYIESINALDLSELEIEGIEIRDEVKKEWGFVGLNNTHFVGMLIEKADEGLNPLTNLWEKEEKEG